MNREPWEDCNWTRSRYFSFIRSALRSATMRYPAAQRYLHSKAYKAPAGIRAKFLVDCEICGKAVAKSRADIDHITPAGKLTDYSDVGGFVERLFTNFEGYQLLCPECHGIKTLADRRGISFEDASIEKVVVAFSKLKPEKQKAVLKRRGADEGAFKNKQTRADAYRNILCSERKS